MSPQSRRRGVALVALGVMMVTARSATAGGGAATDSYEDIGSGWFDLHGLADLYFQGRLNPGAPALNSLRAFDTQNGVPGIGMLRLTVAHRPSEVFGVRLDAHVGAVADGFLLSDPAAARHPALSRGLSYVEQAFVTAKLPVGRGLIVDVGKFATPVGMEGNEALDNWNYSRSLLYTFAEPAYHSGLRVTYPLTEALAVSLFWVNGWDANVFDGSEMRTGAAAATWRPLPGMEVVADYMGGPERAPTRLADPAQSFRSELDAYATYALTERLAIGSTVDYGHDGASGGVSWWGIGGYARAEACKWLAGALRAEHYDDRDGFTSGTHQRLAEVTATLEVRHDVASTRWIGHLEYRRDASDEAAFAGASHQDTLGASLLAAF